MRETNEMNKSINVYENVLYCTVCCIVYVEYNKKRREEYGHYWHYEQ